jgi:hypothetical protein
VASLSLAKKLRAMQRERKRNKEGGNYLMRYDSVGIIREAQMVMSQMGHHLGAFPRASSSPSDENHPLSCISVYFQKLAWLMRI